MKISSNALRLAVIIWVMFILPALLMAAGLIEPTRTIENGSVLQMGKLSVFSEPPEMEITLDGEKIGATPLIYKDVAPGSHILKIKDTETEINVKPGEPLRFSWVEGAFREIPIEEKEKPTQQKPEQETAKKGKKSQEREQKEIELQPLYWPLNPKGPIF